MAIWSGYLYSRGILIDQCRRQKFGRWNEIYYVLQGSADAEFVDDEWESLDSFRGGICTFHHHGVDDTRHSTGEFGRCYSIHVGAVLGFTAANIFRHCFV